jgi:hypothetical protein
MTKNTVFIIGAGASKEVNLPTGFELKSKISKLLDIRFPDGYQQTSGDNVITDAMRILARGSDGARGDINPYLHEAWHIRDALPQAISIDNFIDAHRDNDKIALCGKLAIVRSILDAEKRSLLYFEKSRIDSSINFSRLEKTWYIPFIQLLTENCQKNELTKRFESITLIIFNYDRCIEHFIYYALQNYYRISGTEAAEIVKNINIYHPYGNVGTLPWMDQNGAMEFGVEPNANQLLDLSQKIKTFTEGTDPEASKILEIRKRMGVAQRLVFLGFAFHKLNMQLITPELLLSPTKETQCFATTSGISDSDKEVIDEQIKELYRGNIKVNMTNMYCGNIFAEYWRSLSF